jgi:hypothetical protein
VENSGLRIKTWGTRLIMSNFRQVRETRLPGDHYAVMKIHAILGAICLRAQAPPFPNG